MTNEEKYLRTSYYKNGDLVRHEYIDFSGLQGDTVTTILHLIYLDNSVDELNKENNLLTAAAKERYT